jgi:hypothetical protein
MPDKDAGLLTTLLQKAKASPHIGVAKRLLQDPKVLGGLKDWVRDVGGPSKALAMVSRGDYPESLLGLVPVSSGDAGVREAAFSEGARRAIMGIMVVLFLAMGTAQASDSLDTGAKVKTEQMSEGDTTKTLQQISGLSEALSDVFGDHPELFKGMPDGLSKASLKAFIAQKADAALKHADIKQVLKRMVQGEQKLSDGELKKLSGVLKDALWEHISWSDKLALKVLGGQALVQEGLYEYMSSNQDRLAQALGLVPGALAQAKG